MIAAFASRPSVRPGDRLALHVCADRPATLRFVRAGRLAETMREYRGTPVKPMAGPPGEPGKPYDWPAMLFEIPETWRSGVYTAMLEESTYPPLTRLDAREGRALFVVRPRTPSAPILYNVPLFTYHAYNVAHDPAAEGTCLYNNAKSVTLARPGGGNGGHLWDEAIVDVYDPESPRQTFAHWDQPAIRWLESQFGGVDYACDLDLHEDPSALETYRLLLAFGHHEYWTAEMRERLRAYVHAGGNAAFFSGNTCYFRVTYDAENRSIARAGRWDDDPEERTFGVSYRFGGGKWRGGRPPSGFTVRSASHWMYESCDVRDGDVFGDEERLIGYEFDGVPDEPSTDFSLLAQRRITDWAVDDGSGEIHGGRASLGIVQNGSGALFTGGTVDWARVLAAGEPIVDRITQNVIRRLSSS